MWQTLAVSALKWLVTWPRVKKWGGTAWAALVIRFAKKKEDAPQ